MRSEPNPLARVPAAMRPRLRCALHILLEACDSAAESRRNPWDFAVEIEELRAEGVRKTDLRWLVGKGYVQHAVETKKPGRKKRVFAESGGFQFRQKTCFILTEPGLAAARLGTADVPFYDAERRELWARGQLIKKLTRPAPDQETVLRSFQELGWPPRIDDPLPRKRDRQSPKLRLRDVIKRLKARQSPRLIRFRGDGRGLGILWEFLLD